MEALCCFETPVNFYRTALSYIPEYSSQIVLVMQLYRGKIFTVRDFISQENEMGSLKYLEQRNVILPRFGMGLGGRGIGVLFPAGIPDCLFSTMSVPGVVPTNLLIEWVLGGGGKVAWANS
jgi:hypothetical protein